MILCPQGHGIGHGLEALLHLCALIDIEELHILQQLSAALHQDILDGSGGYRMGHQHGEVSAHGRELGQRNVLRLIAHQRIYRLHIHHSHIGSLTDGIVLQHLRMHLTQEADLLAVVADVGSPTGMEIALLAGSRVILEAAVEAQTVEDHLYVSLQGEEIALADEAQGQLHSLIRQLGQRQLLRQVNVGHLVELSHLVSPVVVRGKRSQHAVQGCGTHHGEVLSQRIHDADLLSLHSVCRQQKLVIDLRGLEGIHIGL